MRLRLYALTLATPLLLFACDNRSYSERTAMQFHFASYETMPLQVFLGDYRDVLQSHTSLLDDSSCLKGWKLEFGEREVAVKVLFNPSAGEVQLCDSTRSWRLDDVRRLPVAGFEVLDIKHDRILFLTGAD